MESRKITQNPKKRRNDGKSPEVLKDRMAERRKIPRNRKRRNDGKSPEIPKEGLAGELGKCTGL